VTCGVDSPLFSLDAIFDGEFKLVTKVVLDREQQAQHQVTAVCPALVPEFREQRSRCQ